MRRRMLAVLATLGLVATAVFGVAPAASANGGTPPGGATYVALGDSMASGNGNLPYVDPGCLRSKKSYPMQIGAWLGTGVESAACTGATTTNVQGQIAGLAAGGKLGHATQLVTLTVGINDLGWQAALGVCATPGMEAQCQAAIQQMIQAGQAVPTQIFGLLVAIRTVAPNALIVVTGYPKLFAANLTSCAIGSMGPGNPVRLPGSLTGFANLAIDGVADVNSPADPQPGLNDGIATATAGFAQSDGNTMFVDVDPAFQGHRLCDSGDRWISGLVNGVPRDRGLHPNTPGMTAFANAISAALPF